MAFSHELCESLCPYVASYNKKKIIIPIDNEFKDFANIGVTRQLLSMRHKQNEELKGILLDWQIYKIRLDTDSQPPMKARYSVKGNWKILRIPEMEKLEARIVNTGKGLLTAIWFDTVPVRIKGNYKDYPVGGLISFDYERFTDEDGFPTMEGTGAVLINQNGINGGLNGELSESGSEAPASPRGSKKRKNESDAEQSPRKTPKIAVTQADKIKSQADKVNESANIESGASTSTPISTNKKTPNRRLVTESAKTPKSQNELPPGYSRVPHKPATGGKTWYSYLTPEGKYLKGRKDVDKHYQENKGSDEEVDFESDDERASNTGEKFKPTDQSFSKTLEAIITNSPSKKTKEYTNPDPKMFVSALEKVLEEAVNEDSGDDSSDEMADVNETAAADVNESVVPTVDETANENVERVSEVAKKKKKKKRKDSYDNVPGFSSI